MRRLRVFGLAVIVIWPPKIPHHGEAQALPLDDAVALIERVQMSSERHAKLSLNAVAMALLGRIVSVVLRNAPNCPPRLPSGSTTTGRTTSPTR